MSHDDESIRAGYEAHGVTSFYEQHGASYRNPHEPVIRRLLGLVVRGGALDLSHVLDLACGSGEATLALREHGAQVVEGIDPYTTAAYHERTGQVAEPFSFEQIASGALEERSYSLVVCSFALHLVAPSWLPLLCYRLAEISPALLVLTPHKRPELRAEWGWQLAEETLSERVRARYYRRTAEPQNG